jgi:dienelactone hydrolase
MTLTRKIVPALAISLLALTPGAARAQPDTAAATPAALQPAPTGPSAQDQWLTIRLSGRTFRLAARVFRPAGDGPFPLVVINHGTPVSLNDAASEKLGFTRAAQWFAAQGYVTVVALRPGFGASDGPYLESAGPCRDRDYLRGGRATGEIEGAIVESAAKLPGVDAHRIVVVGQSAGGFGVLALGDAPPPGVVGLINFAGGRGGDDHEDICSGVDRLTGAVAEFGRANRTPQLWLYAANDHFFAPPVAHAMFQAYQAGSKPAVRFVDLPAFGEDGHKTLARADPSVWADPVSAFLREVSALPSPR